MFGDPDSLLFAAQIEFGKGLSAAVDRFIRRRGDSESQAVIFAAVKDSRDKLQYPVIRRDRNREHSCAVFVGEFKLRPVTAFFDTGEKNPRFGELFLPYFEAAAAHAVARLDSADADKQILRRQLDRPAVGRNNVQNIAVRLNLHSHFPFRLQPSRKQLVNRVN